jgi:hypothetical protein
MLLPRATPDGAISVAGKFYIVKRTKQSISYPEPSLSGMALGTRLTKQYQTLKVFL